MDSVAQLNASLAGRYAVDREIGRGGMATVYLARDVRHDRKVALKVLSPELGAVLGVERFLAEIKVTANLQHPNLLPLFDSGAAEGLLFYVMPYVEGESLRARLEREKQLPVDEAIRIATAIASALDYAHRHGVIHRDLKPENILMHEGQPLIADFGIALAVSNAGGNRITQTGLSLGTPQYMSPEQATGDRVIDGRTDIYSLGAILYEMLVGDPPHLGSTSQAIIARVLTEKPRSVRASRPNVPPYVDAAVERALEKLPADRFATAQEFADAIAGKFATATAAAARDLQRTADSAADSRGLRKLGTGKLAYAALLIVALGAAAVEWRSAHHREPQPVFRAQLVLPKGSTFIDGANGTNFAISPQGDRIAYYASTPSSGGTLLWLRPTDQIESKQLMPFGTAVRAPTFSPDGRWVAYLDGGEIKKVSVDGGPIVTLGAIPEVPLGLSWGPNGFLVVGSASSGLYVIPERGGTPRLIPRAPDEAANRFPLVLPDGKGVVYASFPVGLNAPRLAAVSLAGGAHTNLDVAGSSPLAYLEGQLIYVTTTGALMAVPFDARRRVATGQPVPLVQDVVTDPNGGAKAAISVSGTLIYRSGKSESQAVLVSGGTVMPMTTEVRDFSVPRFSPDGRRVAFAVTSSQSMDVWVYNRDRSTLTKLTAGGANQRPEWTPDGKRVVFTSDRGGQSAIYWQMADGSTPAEMLYKPEEGDPFEAMVSPDGKWLVYRTGPGGHPSRSVFAVALDTKGKSIPIVVSGSGTSYIQMPRLSPDGNWIAYQSNESGVFEIYVRPFPGAGGRVQISVGGGTEPLWAPSGRALYYRQGLNVWSAGVTTGAAFALGERKVAFSGDYLTNPSHSGYDVSRDGSSLLMIRRAGEEVQTIVVQNFVRELIAKTAAVK